MITGFSPRLKRLVLFPAFLTLIGLSGAWSQIDKVPTGDQTTPTTIQTTAQPGSELPTQAQSPAQEQIQAPGPSPIPAPNQPEISFQDLGTVPEGKGCEVWYYEAKKLELAGQLSLTNSTYIDFLYRLAFVFGPEAEAKEAGRTLAQRALKAGDQASVISLASSWIGDFGPDWEMYGLISAAGLATGNYRAVLDAAAAARKNLPGTAKSRISELSFYEYSARNGLGDSTWTALAFNLLKTANLDSWGAKTLRLAAALPGVDSGQAELALMRADFQEKKYASAALHAANSLPALLAPGLARHLISEAARSFINIDDFTGGIAVMRRYFPGAFGAEGQDDPAPAASADRVAAGLSSGVVEERLWVAAYYLARLWQGKGDSDAAAILFLALTESAPSGGDSDGALWNWLDITLKRIAAADIEDFSSSPALASIQAAGPSVPSSQARRPFELGTLAEASQRWKNPSSFDDLVDGYNRSLLKEKAWNDALALFTLLGPRLSSTLQTRFLYLDGRLVELGLATTAPSDKGGEIDKAFSRDNFGKILTDSGAEEYYRTMSAWRLEIAPPYLLALPDLSGKAEPNAAGPDGAASFSTLSALPLIDNYLAFDLNDLASAQALKYLGSADKSLVASLAFRLSSEGQYYPALRLARDAVNRGLGSQFPELYSLIYPRAWPEVVAEGAAIPGIPEALAYAIIRSESVFDPTSVSYAGAVGLTQLMPSTASETARGLKMTNYSLTDPRDNVRIGMTYYSYMLNRFGGKPVRAMFAYNAGPGRMQTWARESGELPDDLLLETLSIAQPRQYAKNIIQAALAYGKLHYAIQPQDLLEYLVNATPLPAAPLSAALPAMPLPISPVPAAPQVPAEPAGQTTVQSATASPVPSPAPSPETPQASQETEQAISSNGNSDQMVLESGITR